MLPLRSVGRSNFVMVCVNKFNNVDSKATYFDENCCVIYIYIYISSSFGGHTVRMTTTSSSTLQVGLTVAEEAYA